MAGKVRHPGIAVLDAGARVVDALQAAGGAKPGVDLTGLNLARVLVDGEQVLVGTDPPTGLAAAASPPPAGSGSGATSTSSAGNAPGTPATVVNLNTATEADLDTLPDVGPVTAQSILTWRDQHGGFSSVDELLEVDGIGEVTLGKLAPYVTV
ncbi:ComEA family DNA-binding protein [Nocardioides anomalus]|uniref:ComEA family DNA-binding protein n=1 Tax=Nocardioides anomalus TaxID=2712223 RepID=A0A6G6WC80_9ACTN|nr:helix-hairpin-helix domain-containing protein [Nocardioides anomalus]QIG42705.1 ComEA family DNA-binding protein [Nocardioides anomalus]